MIDEKEYKEFLEKNEKGHYAQGLEWAKIKSDWKNEVIIVRDEKGKIKASLSLLIRKLPYINSHLMYAPRGPVCDIDDEGISPEVHQMEFLLLCHTRPEAELGFLYTLFVPQTYELHIYPSAGFSSARPYCIPSRESSHSAFWDVSD